MRKIVLTGGGTAGHVTPNLALIPSLLELGYEIRYIGSTRESKKNLSKISEYPTAEFLPENCAAILILKTFPIPSVL